VITYRLYCLLLRIQLTSSTQIKPSQSFADSFGRSTNILSTYLLTSAVELLNDAGQCRMQDKTLDLHMQTLCVGKSWKLVEINLTTLL